MLLIGEALSDTLF